MPPLNMQLHRLGAAAGAVSSTTPPLLIVLHHATGFCGSVWRPFIHELSHHAKVAGVSAVAATFDFSGHGASRDVAANAREWGVWCPRDVLRVVAAAKEAEGFSDVLAVGHSMGGAAALMAEIQAPGTYKRIVAYEPIVFPVKNMTPADAFEDSPLALGAERRKARWPTMEAAHAYFISKPLFASWNAAALQGYYDGAIMPSPNGSGVELCCRPSFEADMYRGYHQAYDHVEEIGCPVDVLVGGTSAHMARYGQAQSLFEALSKKFKHGSFQIVPNASHFLIMEAPAECAARTAKLFGWTKPVHNGKELK